MSSKQSVIFGGFIGLLLALAFAFGFIINDLVDLNGNQIAVAADTEDAYGLLSETEDILQRVYLRDLPSPSARAYGAIRGVLDTLDDRNTFFIEPPVAQSEAHVLAGTYGGIGVQIQLSESGDLLLFPFDDSPAMEAGIQDGDQLIAINTGPVNFNMGLDTIDQQLRGEVKEGNGVEITIITNEDGEEQTYYIEFAVINVPSVVWRVLDETAIGYIQILRFTNRTPDELDLAIEALSNAEVDALVLDLRDNSGGLLAESIEVANRFLDGGVVTYEIRQSSEETFEATDGGSAVSWPLVVLVNDRTASASELVAGAIQDNQRGIIVGQTTFGKGTVQQIYVLSDGSSIHVTSAEWLTPSRSHIDGVGLVPDIAMIPDENGRDVELGEAVRHLNELLAS
ncbi:MAG: hypothetical protein CL607_07625 [Anaerolineaceae bacterium]|nr:hypothetical protein [Anaerolineaceae bacterium]